jgi:serine phosphatase RsbU (regulator of sigma subunit)/PAS domain-containing protein
VVGAYLGVPLHDVGGHVVGALCVYDGAARSWTEDQVHLLEELGVAVESELERLALENDRDQAQFRLAVAHAAGGIGSWDWDSETDRMTVDERTTEMFGAPVGPGEASLPELEKRIHPDDAARFGPAMRQALAAGEDYAAEVRVVGADGRTRWVVVRGRPLRDLTGALSRMVGAMYETTEQHEAAASASASADLLSLLAAASDLLSGSLDPVDAVRSLTRVVVPQLADWSIVSLVGEDGVLRDVEAWHHDPELRGAVDTFAQYRLVGRHDPAGSLSTYASGQPFVLDVDVVEYAGRVLRSQEAIDALTALDLASVAVLPLFADDQVIGLITLARGADRSPMTPAELATAVDVSRRASTTLTIARAFGREREISEGLQRSLLTEPVQPDHLEVVVRYVPAAAAAQVGGDWYDAFMQPDGATLLVVGDVVGHDTAAAAAMGQLRNLLRGIAVASGESPASVLTQMDHAVETLRLDTTATAVVARLEQEVDEVERAVTRLRWSNAGHPPALLIDVDGSSRLLAEHDLLLGVVPDVERREQVTELRRGSTLLMYTDGLVERREEELDAGLERLRATVESLGELPLQELADQVVATMVPREAADDIALLAVRLHPQDRPRPSEAGPEIVPANVPPGPVPPVRG